MRDSSKNGRDLRDDMYIPDIYMPNFKEKIFKFERKMFNFEKNLLRFTEENLESEEEPLNQWPLGNLFIDIEEEKPIRS